MFIKICMYLSDRELTAKLKGQKKTTTVRAVYGIRAIRVRASEVRLYLLLFKFISVICKALYT